MFATGTMTNKTVFKPPDPIEDEDFHIGEMHGYTVCIELYVEGLEESYSEADACYEAVNKFRNGMIDGDATVVHSEHVRDVELCFGTDEPFDRVAWQKAKLLELGLNSDGKPLRPCERKRPSNERTLEYYDKSYWLRQWRKYNENRIVGRWFK
jgi:hypothetical protein